MTTYEYALFLDRGGMVYGPYPDLDRVQKAQDSWAEQGSPGSIRRREVGEWEPLYHVLAVLDNLSVDGRKILSGALQWSDPLPLTIPGGTIVGKVTDVQQRDDTIVGVFIWVDSQVEGSPAIELDQVEVSPKAPEGEMWVTGGRLRAVCLVPNPSWPDRVGPT